MKELKCLVCGMNINGSNYNFNENAFLYKNNEEHVEYCPFCGVGKEYLQSQQEVYKVSSEEVDLKTIKILDSAMKLEVFNGEFYLEASKLAKSEELKKKFLHLSRIEYTHARVHKNLGGFKELPLLRRVDYTKYEDDTQLLEIARKREEHAVAFYSKNHKNVSSNIIKGIFNALSEVEKEHIVLTSVK
ncbi:metal-iron-binding protein [Clostridium bovifaecis]|uniref:Metal-iron-binding protein n=1 Tax=Clostridium bovifaecis TaxID=2184719 RepID=A0A6I6EXQ4_9CLOT|nr:metal-iron-binding protein [Clostridium bovifaecis]